MKQAKYGLVLYIFLMLPPVITFLESVMAIHMHMQMPLLLIVGMLLAPFFQKHFPQFFGTWNKNGVPGITLFMIIVIYWLMPRTMDEAVTEPIVEVFKFISLPFLAGIPLRDSWSKLTGVSKNIIYVLLSILFGIMAWLYIASPTQLCNNYLLIEQKALGWGFLLLAASIVIYFLSTIFIDESKYV
ncbi:hypothetical protein [Lysinibacillus sp. BW-2-10]|uniref:hypothetical protein n=1 Tax=Lysinibacillus sp. BW-2-10 TaxID=2590030 RepID=UPI0011811380|nr:hypothetical protein [Lysinibacillus sp. BW-2-10]TSI10685.1 hypothetical protein FJQ64_03250 [Lysinibacillus sp. BW-2-10]